MQRFLNTLWIYILSAILLGAYIYQDVEHQDPCSLCVLQRLSMICVAIGPMLNLRFKIHAIHYAVSLAGCILGGAISLRQICLHICPGFPTFGYRVLGLELYSWSFLVFAFSLVGLACILFIYKEEKQTPNIYEKGAIGLMALIAFSNFITTFFSLPTAGKEVLKRSPAINKKSTLFSIILSIAF